ncbi:MAG: type II secretion system F family protein [Deltaproteobacteria bacterium]|nr:type II secretion system F family protein [Deltaproteobacteria bacterium]
MPQNRAVEKQVALPLRALEELLVPLAQSLEAGLTLLEHANGPASVLMPRPIQRALDAGARQGRSVTELFTSLGILSNAQLALLAAAEARGEPAVALRAVAARVGEERKDLRRLALGLLYPAFLVLTTLLVQPLPKVVTEGLAGYGSAVLGPLLLFTATIAAAVFFVPRLHPDGLLLRGVRGLLLLIPPTAYAARHRALASFADVLGASISAGLTFRDSVPLACEATGHPSFRGRADRVLGRIGEGATLADALMKELRLPPTFAALVAHGERVGKLDEILPQLSIEHAAKARAALAATMVVTLLFAGVAVMGYVAYEVASGWNRIFEDLAKPLMDLKGLGGLEGLFPE